MNDCYQNRIRLQQKSVKTKSKSAAEIDQKMGKTYCDLIMYKTLKPDTKRAQLSFELFDISITVKRFCVLRKYGSRHQKREQQNSTYQAFHHFSP